MSDFVIELGCREVDILKFAVSRSDPNVHLVDPTYSMISLSSAVLDVVELKETAICLGWRHGQLLSWLRELPNLRG
jgi:hypothetical protein